MSKRSRRAAARGRLTEKAPVSSSAPVREPHLVQHSKAARIEAHRREARRRSLVRGGIVTVILAVVVAAAALALGVGQPEIGVGVIDEGGVGRHLPDGSALTQRNRPPSSGPHYASRARYGLSTTPVAPGNWIHALEHGAVVILYKCASDEECIKTGQMIDAQVYVSARDGRFGERKLVITPYSDMDAPITAVAWGRKLELQELDAERILAFYDRYLDRGPEQAA